MLYEAKSECECKSERRCGILSDVLKYAWGSTKAKEAGLAYDDKKKKMVWKK